MKSFIIVIVIISYQTLFNSPTTASDQPQPAEKIHYEPLSILQKTFNSGIENYEDSEDPIVVEKQYLRNRETYHLVENVENTIKNIFASTKDICESNFSSNKFFSDKKITIATDKGTDEEKTMEILRYDVNPSTFPEKVHKCSCNCKENNQSICVDQSVYLLKGVGGKDSFFITKKNGNGNLVLAAKITVSDAKPEAQPELKPGEKKPEAQPELKPGEKKPEVQPVS